MSLFEVPGWSVPSAPVSQASKKRKRPTAKDTEDVDEAQRIHAAQKNIEKLMRSLGEGVSALEGEDSGPATKKKREGKQKKGKRKAEEGGKSNLAERGRQVEKKAHRTISQERSGSKQKDSSPQKSQQRTDTSPKGKKKQKQKRVESVDARSDVGSTHEDAPPPAAANTPNSKSSGQTKGKDSQGLTALQANMKKSLDGARFRWINETLYKSDSATAHELMKEDPAVFADYHTGFRHQVESWPTNPVSHYISTLSSYPAKTVIADLGCGDAALARALVPIGMNVLSFDLISDGAYVVEADTCTHVPLPGSENRTGSQIGEGEGQVVDVVVCALSLMGINWPGCIREAWRVLRPGGEFKIAEVTSRFGNVEEFVSFVSSFGFKLKAKDERNTHFTLFDFKKVPRKPKGDKDWEKLLSRGSILKPCEYKRR